MKGTYTYTDGFVWSFSSEVEHVEVVLQRHYLFKMSILNFHYLAINNKVLGNINADTLSPLLSFS